MSGRTLIPFLCHEPFNRRNLRPLEWLSSFWCLCQAIAVAAVLLFYKTILPYKLRYKIEPKRVIANVFALHKSNRYELDQQTIFPSLVLLLSCTLYSDWYGATIFTLVFYNPIYNYSINVKNALELDYIIATLDYSNLSIKSSGKLLNKNF